MAAGRRSQRAGAGTARRTPSRRLRAPRPEVGATSKVGEIVRLIEALVDGLGARGRTRLGRGIGTLLLDAYGGRGQKPPRWVRELIAVYTPRTNGR
jgi:hypothetical protein